MHIECTGSWMPTLKQLLDDDDTTCATAMLPGECIPKSKWQVSFMTHSLRVENKRFQVTDAPVAALCECINSSCRGFAQRASSKMATTAGVGMGVEDLHSNAAKVYDRQIRLWGVKAQERLMQTRVLMVGLSASNVEASKNLVLAGIGLRIVDDSVVKEADLKFNCFVRRGNLGERKSHIMRQGLQDMNPLVKVTELHADLLSSDDDTLRGLLSDCTAVCIAAEVYPLSFLIHLDSICRNLGVAFFTTLSCGLSGFMFSDMSTHTIESTDSNNSESATGSDAVSMEFPSLQETLSCPMNSFEKKTDRNFYALFALLRWELLNCSEDKSEVSKDQGNSLSNEDSFLKFAYGLFQEFGVQNVVDTETLRLLFRSHKKSFIATGAVLGGLLAQEIRKFATKQMHPLPNCVVFSAADSQASVARIPPA